MTLKQIIAWYTIAGDVDTHRHFINNVGRVGRNEAKNWYFRATVGNKTVSFNYRKYGDRIMLHNGAHVEIDVFTDRIQQIKCRTVKELNEAIK